MKWSAGSSTTKEVSLPPLSQLQRNCPSRSTNSDRICLTPHLYGPEVWFGCGWQQKRHAATPPPAGVWRRMERNRQKPVGRDKGSLTEQQTKGTVTTMIQMRRKHNTNRTTHRAALLDRTAAASSRATSEFPPPRSPLPPGTQHDGTWYGIPGSVWPGGSAHPAVPLPGVQWKLTLS